MKKRAFIRGNDTKSCPFGLNIPSACGCVGGAIHNMTPLDAVKDEDKKQTLAKANKLVYLYGKDGNDCPFMDQVLENHNKVDCDWGDTGEGQKSVPMIGSPLFVKTFEGVGADTLQAFPLGFYSSDSPSRNMFFGMFSFLGSKEVDEIVKIADKYDECGEKEKSDKIDALVEKIEEVRSEEDFEKMLQEIEEVLGEYREEHQDKRKDSGLLRGLADKYWGPRQYNEPR